MKTQPKKSLKVLITGGHVTPALAVLEEIKRRFPNWEIVFVGRYYALEGQWVVAEEYRLVRDHGLRFLPLTTGRLSRHLSWASLFSLAKLPWGFIQALWYVWRERPAIVVSFGGYLAVPVVVAAAIFGIPTITHEQTRVPGLANRLISFLAARVCVSFADQISQFPPDKAVYTGLPLRQEIFKPPPRLSLPLATNLPLIFISGGSTGAQSVNALIYPILPELSRDLMIVHQVGRLSDEEAREYQKKLPPSQVSHYLPLPYLDTADYAGVLQLAILIVGRAGANTVGELAALGKVALFIPLPWSGGGEQQENANYLARSGSSLVLSQPETTPAKLLTTIRQMLGNIGQFQKQAKLLSKTIQRDASRRVVDEVVKYAWGAAGAL